MHSLVTMPGYFVSYLLSKAAPASAVPLAVFKVSCPSSLSCCRSPGIPY